MSANHGGTHHDSARHGRKLLLTWLALLALLALSAASAFLPLGLWNGVANLGIAVVKAVLVALVFMRLAAHGALARLVVFTALLTLALLLGLSNADYATRHIFGAPWSAPPAGQTQG